MKRSLSAVAVPVVLGLLAGAAVAGPSVLVDEVHGQPCRDTLADLWPDCQVDALCAADFPITNVLASGVLAPQDTTITFQVPAGVEMLYGRFDCPSDMFQHPFISVYRGTSHLCGQFHGGFHLEDPVPGEYEIEYSIWDDIPIPFEVGTGPKLITAERLAPYDVVFRLHENTYMLFVGTVPEYTTHEEIVLIEHAQAGGGNLLLREPLLDIALKPIIDLTSPVDLTCEVSVVVPGAITYAEPAVEETAWAGGTIATWSDVGVHAGETTQLLYEAGLRPSQPRLEVSFAGAQARVRNHATEPLLELMLVRSRGDGSWDVIAAGDVPGDAEMAVPGSRHVTRADAVEIVRRTVTEGGFDAGLSTAQMSDFQGHYRWADRVLDDADGRDEWSAVYRIGRDACDRLMPLATDPPAVRRTRALWFWVSGIPTDSAWQSRWPEPIQPPTPASTAPGASTLTVDEYGFVYQSYPSFGVELAAKELDWMGWQFHDDSALIDPTDNSFGDPYQPYFDTPGGHPDAVGLLEGLSWLEGESTGAILAPWEERLLVGDDDAQTDDGFFQPYSFPAVAVGRSWGEGRAAALHDGAFLDRPWPYNKVYLRRLLDWVGDELTDAPIETPAAQVSVLQAQPNPFNPRLEVVFALTAPGSVSVDVFDAAGRRVARLFEGTLGAVEHRLIWDGCDDRARQLAAGVYLVRVSTEVGARSCKVTLVD